MRKTLVAVFLYCLVASGCANFDTDSVRALSEAEIEVLEDTHERLKENQAAVRGSLDDLADSVAFALRHQHRLSSNVAKAKLLESMRSPWTSRTLSATQKEVALYHLFELAEAEQAAMTAKMRERRAEIGNLKKAYGELVTSMAALVNAQGQLLTHLEQPTSTRVGLVMEQLLVESRAFREALENEDDPRLQRLAESVADKEKLVADARDKLVKLLEFTE